MALDSGQSLTGKHHDVCYSHCVLFLGCIEYLGGHEGKNLEHTVALVQVVPLSAEVWYIRDPPGAQHTPDSLSHWQG